MCRLAAAYVADLTNANLDGATYWNTTCPHGANTGINGGKAPS